MFPVLILGLSAAKDAEPSIEFHIILQTAQSSLRIVINILDSYTI